MAGIYLHIPFCKKLCSYCDFFKVISTTSDHSKFLNAIIKEAEVRKNYLSGENVSTIYLGGGTPSVLSPDEISFILEKLYALFTVDEDCEITVEINPDDVNKEYLVALRNLKINRISLGIQSWRDEDLRLLNRRHSAAQAEDALKSIHDAGFENITVDLIYGIPGMTPKDWEANLDKTFSFDIKHLSAYHLTIEPGTLFARMKEKGVLKEIDEEESLIQFNSLIEKAEKAGYIQYEISNFGREGYFSRHNTNYWRQISYLGLGPSAHSFNKYSRQWNVKNLNSYITSVINNKPFSEGEELSSKTRFNEYIMTSLRTMWGIDLDYVEKTFEKEGHDYLINMAGKFKNYGLMKQEDNSLVLTNQGKMISDNIISEFIVGEE
jgi:oxygen-independent coproporphyrinogen III oxidase